MPIVPVIYDSWLQFLKNAFITECHYVKVQQTWLKYPGTLKTLGMVC